MKKCTIHAKEVTLSKIIKKREHSRKKSFIHSIHLFVPFFLLISQLSFLSVELNNKNLSFFDLQPAVDKLIMFYLQHDNIYHIKMNFFMNYSPENEVFFGIYEKTWISLAHSTFSMTLNNPTNERTLVDFLQLKWIIIVEIFLDMCTTTTWGEKSAWLSNFYHDSRFLQVGPLFLTSASGVSKIKKAKREKRMKKWLNIN